MAEVNTDLNQGTPCKKVMLDLLKPLFGKEKDAKMVDRDEATDKGRLESKKKPVHL